MSHVDPRDHGAPGGIFNPRARAAIYELDHGRCLGCGRTDLSAQHRRARGMGGTSNLSVGHPANGVPLCGGSLAGVMGCHGWAERFPRRAALLGWRLLPDEDALTAPFWSRVYQWRRWVEEDDGFVGVRWLDPFTEVDRLLERETAIHDLRAWRNIPA